MLSVERKKTEKIDWVKPLTQFIRNQYSAQDLDSHQEAINVLQQLREDVRNSQDRTETSKDLLLKYFLQLQSIEARFPIGENNIRISFPWFDIVKNKKNAQYVVVYEKLCILFNLGAMFSQLGAAQNRSSVDGLKAACQNFQVRKRRLLLHHKLAAGAFQLLKDELEKHPQSNIPDLSHEFVAVLLNLMLAQAQECFYEKAVKDNMKAGIVAKLAAQAADFYDIANNLITSPTLSSVVPKNWASHVQLKSIMYKAAAHYRASIVHGEANEYGLEVSRLQAATKLMEDGKKRLLKNLPADVQTIFNSMHASITATLAKKEKENDTIYLATVPAESSLPAIEKKIIVKATPLTEVSPASYVDLFAKLIPFAVTQKLSIYQEKKDSLLRNELRVIDEQNQIAIAYVISTIPTLPSSLSSMNLPGAIEALETPGDSVPQALVEKMNTVRGENGARMILELIDTLNKLAEEDFAFLDKGISKLDAEEKEDNEMRQRFGSRWGRTTSHTLTVNLRQEAAKYKGNIEHARKSDAYVMKKFQDHQQFIVRLSGSIDEIKKILPSNNAAVGPTAKAVADLKQSLTQLDKLIAERATIREDISTLAKNDDVASKFLTNSSRSDDEIMAEELKKYEPLQSKLQSSFSTQAALLNQIQQQNGEFVAKKQSNNQNAQREQVLQQLNTAFKIYGELKNNLREGIQFYTNFQELLKQFSQKCDDFVFARQTEKQDLLTEIQRASTGINPNAPPEPSYPAYSQQPPNIPGGWQPNMKPVYGQPPVPYQQQIPPMMGYQAPPNPYQQQPQQPPPMYNPYAAPPNPYQQPPPQQPPPQNQFPPYQYYHK